MGPPYIAEAIQVAKTLQDPEVKHREIRGLLEAMRTYHLKEGLILTMDEEMQEEIEEEGQLMTIRELPIWKWLLESFSVEIPHRDKFAKEASTSCRLRF